MIAVIRAGALLLQDAGSPPAGTAGSATAGIYPSSRPAPYRPHQALHPATLPRWIRWPGNKTYSGLEARGGGAGLKLVGDPKLRPGDQSSGLGSSCPAARAAQSRRPSQEAAPAGRAGQHSSRFPGRPSPAGRGGDLTASGIPGSARGPHPALFASRQGVAIRTDPGQASPPRTALGGRQSSALDRPYRSCTLPPLLDSYCGQPTALRRKI